MEGELRSKVEAPDVDSVAAHLDSFGRHFPKMKELMDKVEELAGPPHGTANGVEVGQAISAIFEMAVNLYDMAMDLGLALRRHVEAYHPEEE